MDYTTWIVCRTTMPSLIVHIRSYINTLDHSIQWTMPLNHNTITNSSRIYSAQLTRYVKSSSIYAHNNCYLPVITTGPRNIACMLRQLQNEHFLVHCCCISLKTDGQSVSFQLLIDVQLCMIVVWRTRPFAINRIFQNWHYNSCYKLTKLKTIRKIKL